MNVAKLIRFDIANGTGIRVSLFVSGCGRNCLGCFNKEAQNPDFGIKFDNTIKEKIFNELSQNYCRGLSILGGEPMSVLSDNRQQVIALCKEVKEKFPTKDIWMWTGYTLQELQNDSETIPILKLVDTIVDGAFVLDLKDLSTPFRGSTNQRILHLGIDY